LNNIILETHLGRKAMARKDARAKITSVVSASSFTQEDVDKFKKSADRYTRKATSSKKKAQETLISLGIYTKSGRLSKNYK
jgi:hypothetical protein